MKIHDEPGTVTAMDGVYSADDEDSIRRFSDWLNNAPNTVGAYYVTMNIPKPNIFFSSYCLEGDGSFDC